MKNILLSYISLMSCLLISLQSFAIVNVQLNDGRRYTSVLINGSSVIKYDIVFVGDGFTSSTADQTNFNNAVDNALNAMRNTQPYADNICAFNIWRVNVISAESGIDHPISGISRNTELNCTFGDNIRRPSRAIFSSTPERVTEAASYAPAHDAIYVLVNDPEHGGSTREIIYTSLSSDMQETVVHELGHFVGRLADEYTCFFCDGRMERVYSGLREPSLPNITIQTNRSLIKWRRFIEASTSLPTTVDTPPGVVGLWLGGYYSPTVIYRPQFNCLMKESNTVFCRVCNNRLSNILRPYCTLCERDPTGFTCLLSTLRPIIVVQDLRFILKIPDCCFCPLILNIIHTEIELNINMKEYNIQITDGSKTVVKTNSVTTENGGTIISFDAARDNNYFLIVEPRQQKKAIKVNVKLIQNGQQAVLF